MLPTAMPEATTQRAPYEVDRQTGAGVNPEAGEWNKCPYHRRRTMHS